MFSRRHRGARAGSAPDGSAPDGSGADEPTPAPVSVVHSAGVLDRVGGGLAKWSLRLLLFGAALVVLFWVLGQLWVVVLPVLLGLVLAAVLWPLARLLRRVLPAALAALLALLTGMALLVAVGFLLAPQIADQWPELTDAVIGGLEDVEDLITGPPLNLDADQLEELVDQAITKVEANAGSIASGVVTGVTTVGSMVVNAVLAAVLCFFFLKDGPKFLPWVTSWVGPRAGDHLAEVSRRNWDVLTGFIRAQAIVGLVDAVAIGIGLAVLGVPFALPLAVLVFFGAFIPIVGAFVSGALAALVALVTDGWTTALIVVALIVIVQQLEGNVLQPVLVGRTLDLHAGLVILAVTAGGSLAGILGAFLAVPVVAVAVTVARYAREQFLETTGEAAPARAGPSRS